MKATDIKKINEIILNSNLSDDEKVKKIVEFVDKKEQVIMSLLSVARCPHNNCDNSGTLAYERANGEWEHEPCEWCYTKKELISDKN